MMMTFPTDRKNLWHQTVYAQFWKEIEPFDNYQYFRPLNRAYNGDNTFWTVPSPEPNLDDAFWRLLASHLDNQAVQNAALCLAHEIARWESDGNRLIFAAILRAGVPIADWLCHLFPGSVAVSLSLFVGLGIDQVALNLLQKTYPERKILFVDGWTGRGGVSREIAKLNAGPLAVLIDPWGWADFSGTCEDIFCPTACFTGVSTLGFSRTFYTEPDHLFAAYLFPSKYYQSDLVKAWQHLCPSVTTIADKNTDCTEKYFFKETPLRLHSNEVCRALINADPDTLYFQDDAAYVKAHFPLLLALAEIRKVSVVYGVRELERYKTHAACSFKNR